jgi:hypothetical protein
MIAVYVLVDEKWVAVKNTERFSMTYEVGERVPVFQFETVDPDFRLSPFLQTELSSLLKKGNKVKVIKDGKRIATGYIDHVEYTYPEASVVVSCRGVLSLLADSRFSGKDWSYESGSFSQSIPSERYIQLPSSTTAVWDVKLDGSYFFNYDFDFERSRIVITDSTSTGTLSGKYFTTASPHIFLASLLSGIDFASVPLVNGNDSFVFSIQNLISGVCDADNIDEHYTTRILDLGMYTTGYSTISFSNATIKARGANTKNEVLEQEWVEVSSGDNLSSKLGGFFRYLQFDITWEDGFDGITLSLSGNAPAVMTVVFDASISKMNALSKLLACYCCTFFEDQNGTLRIEHRNDDVQYEKEIAFGEFTKLSPEISLTPKVISVSGLSQEFQPYGTFSGAKRQFKGAVTFEGDLSGEENIANGIAWNAETLQNVGLLRAPYHSTLKMTTHHDLSLFEMVKVVTVYRPNDRYVFIPFSDSGIFPYVEDKNYSSLFYQVPILAYSASVYRVVSKVYENECLWAYEMAEVYRFPSIFEDLYEYWIWYPLPSDLFNLPDIPFPDIPLPDIPFPDIVYVWDEEEGWQEVPFDYSDGVVHLPEDVEIPQNPPSEPIPGTNYVPPSPIVFGYQPPSSIPPSEHRVEYDVWDCTLALDEDGWEFEGGWWLYPPYQPSSPDYPYLKWMKTNPPKDFGDLPQDAIPVSTPQGLHDIRNNLSGYYYLTNDIDMSSWGSFEPIQEFSGTIDGRGFTIRNLLIGDAEDARGMIGYAVGNATIKNLRIENATLSTGDYECDCGILIGAYWGDATSHLTIEKVYVSGSVSSLQNAGGIVGSAEKNISISYAYFSGSVSASWNAGGLIGCIWDRNNSQISITRCWVNGTVSSGWNAAGLIGDSCIDYVTDVSVSECASLCDVSAGWSAGGFAGNLYSRCLHGVGSYSVSNSFCRGSVSILEEWWDIAGFAVVYNSTENTTCYISKCYCATTLTPKEPCNVKGFVYLYYRGLNVQDSYYDGSICSYEDEYASSAMRKGYRPSGWDFETIWE